MEPEDLGFLLKPMLGVPGVRGAAVISTDGLVMHRSQRLDREEAERLAATCSGLASLAQSVADAHGTQHKAVQQIMAAFTGGCLFVRGAGDRSHLVVVTEAAAQIDAAMVAYEMQALVGKIGEPNLTASPRTGT